jgi:hypothetical protein
VYLLKQTLYTMFNPLIFLFVVYYASSAYTAPASFAGVHAVRGIPGNSVRGIPLGDNNGGLGGLGLNTLGNPTNLVNGITGGALGGVVGGATGSAAVGATVGGTVQDSGELLGATTGIVKGVTETVTDAASGSLL